jgi:TonB-linked SusC/RagA family outer membrane protein
MQIDLLKNIKSLLESNSLFLFHSKSMQQIHIFFVLYISKTIHLPTSKQLSMGKLKAFMLMGLLLTAQFLWAQTQVTGRVTDSRDGSPLAGVTVTVRNTNNSTTTDENGSFTLNAPANSRLVFSYVGFQSVERTAGSGPLSISLTQGESGLTEVVVTGYKTSTKRDFVGSASTVSAARFRQTPIASFDQALQGQVPGILVQANSGQPGAAASILIRGRGSILGSNQPLYVLDGIQITAGDFATLNPADFESISVLKDASATAAYGSRGANGVIVITSRKGRAGSARLGYDVQYGFSTQPESRLELMNTNQKLDYELFHGNPNGFTPAEIAERRLIETDWADEFFRTGRTAQHILSASGGSGKTTYFLSGSFFDQTGTVVNTGLKRYTGRANVESNAGAFTFGLNSSFGYSDFTNTSENNTSIAAPLNAIRWLNPYEKPYNDDGTYTEIFSGQPHALQELLENNNLRQQYKGVGNVYINYTAPFLKGLSFRANVGGDFRINEGSSFTDPTTVTGASATGNRGSFSRGTDRLITYTATTSATYATDFAREHTLSVSLFNEIVKTTGRNFSFTGFGLGGPFENEAGITPGTSTNNFIPLVGGGGFENALLSYFTDIRYGFKNRYFINVGARRDGSSRFGANRQYANFGSVGASWIVSDEPFMAGLKDRVFNELKFKVSYGSAGNQEGIGSFQARELYGRSFYNGTVGLVQNQLANPELQWERKTTFNTGLEIATLKNRLRGGVEFYNSVTSDLFLNKQLSRTTGYSSLLSNIGELQNRGVEVSLDGDLLNTKDFVWKANVSLTYNQNRVKKLVGDQQEIISGITINRVGETMNSWYMVRNAGINPQNGNPYYLDKDGKQTETYNPDARVVLGSLETPYFGGFGSSLNFKGFEVSAFFSFATGNKIFNNDRTNVENPAYIVDQLSTFRLSEWRKPGDIAELPGVNANYDNFSRSSYYLEDGDFLRLRNASVSYSIPSRWATAAKMRSARLFIQGQNLVTWTKFLGFDPEISTGSLNGAQYPALRTITFGLNVGL